MGIGKSFLKIEETENKKSTAGTVVGKFTKILDEKDPLVSAAKASNEYKRAMTRPGSISFKAYSLQTVDLDFKTPEELLHAAPSRTTPATFVAPREGRAVIGIIGPDGEPEMFEDFIMVSASRSDRDNVQFHQTLSRPYVTAFGKAPMTLSLQAVMLNSRELELEFLGKLAKEGKTSGELAVEASRQGGDWRNRFVRFFERARASTGRTVTINSQNYLYTGPLLSITEHIEAQTDAMAAFSMEMVVLEFLPPIIEGSELVQIDISAPPEETKKRRKIAAALDRLGAWVMSKTHTKSTEHPPDAGSAVTLSEAEEFEAQCMEQ